MTMAMVVAFCAVVSLVYLTATTVSGYVYDAVGARA